MGMFEKLNRLSESHGELRGGKGLVSGASSACWPFTSRST